MSLRSSRAGFSLLETLFALFVLSTTLFISSELQYSSLMRVMASPRSYRSRILRKKYLYKVFKQPEIIEKKTQKRQFSDPECTLVIATRDIHKKSALAEYKDDIMLVSGLCTWDMQGKNAQIPMIMCVQKKMKSSKAKKSNTGSG